MKNAEDNALQLGRLMSSVETLVGSMQAIQASVLAQSAVNSRLEEQLATAEKRDNELRVALTGTDGSSGLLARLTALENGLQRTSDDVTSLKKDFDKIKATAAKIAFAVGTAGAAGTAGGAKLMAIFGL